MALKISVATTYDAEQRDVIESLNEQITYVHRMIKHLLNKEASFKDESRSEGF